MSNSSIYSVGRTLPGVTTWGQSAMAMKGYSIFPKAPVLLYPGLSLKRVIPLCRDAVGVFYRPSLLGWMKAGIHSSKKKGWGFLNLGLCGWVKSSERTCSED